MLVTSINFSKIFSTLAQKNLIIDLATFIKSHANVMNLEKSKYMDISIWREQLRIYFFITLYSINTHFDASTTDFGKKKKKKCGKRRNYSSRAISSFPTFFFYTIRKLYLHLSIFLTSYLYLLLI